MDYASQVTQPRLWTGGGAEPCRIAEEFVRALPRREAATRARRRLLARPAHGPRTFVVVALAVLAVAGAVTSALTYRAGLAWRDRAEAESSRTRELTAQLGDAQMRDTTTTGELSKAHEQLVALASQLQRSEADVAQLERRLQALGTEKARAEDEREAVRGDRDRLAAVAGLATRVGQDVDTCVDRLASWLASRPSQLQITQHTLATWASSGDSVAAICANARLSNGELKMAVNG